MKRILKRIRQLLRHGPGGLLWLAYVVLAAGFVHRLSIPFCELKRRLVRRSLRSSHRRENHEALHTRLKEHIVRGPRRGVRLASLAPHLDAQVASIRSGKDEEVPLARFDHNGLLQPLLGPLWNAPQTDKKKFLPRARNKLTLVDSGGLVDRCGYIGVRKEFGPDRAAFINELTAALHLAESGCNVPDILGVDWEKNSITFAYMYGAVVRESLAEAGAPIRNLRAPSARSSSWRNYFHRRRLRRQRVIDARQVLPQVLDKATREKAADALLAIHRAGYVLQDIKYGNLIIEEGTGTPIFVDFEHALSLKRFGRRTGLYLRDRDSAKFNEHFDTDLLTARRLREMPRIPGGQIYAPVYAGAGIWWGQIWNPDIGVGRWRYFMRKHLPIPRGGKVLDLGANNGFNALSMLRAGASEVVAVELDPLAIEQGQFMKRVFEWADNREYAFTYVHGSHGELERYNLGRFDQVTAFCTLYYLPADQMRSAVRTISGMTEVLVQQANTDRLISRNDPDTFTKASLEFTIELAREYGFPEIAVVAPRGYSRPLVIGRSRR